MIRVLLPFPLRKLAGVEGEVLLDLPGPATLGALLDAVEAAHPVLTGAIRDPGTGRRRPLIRFFACREDISHEPMDLRLPDAVVSGDEPLLVVGAMAGG